MQLNSDISRSSESHERLYLSVEIREGILKACHYFNSCLSEGSELHYFEDCF